MQVNIFVRNLAPAFFYWMMLTLKKILILMWPSNNTEERLNKKLLKYYIFKFIVFIYFVLQLAYDVVFSDSIDEANDDKDSLKENYMLRINLGIIKSISQVIIQTYLVFVAF